MALYFRLYALSMPECARDFPVKSQRFFSLLGEEFERTVSCLFS